MHSFQDRDRADAVENILKIKGMSAISVHRQIEIDDRKKHLSQFRESSILAVCTDLYARAIDIPSIKVVINYDLPTNIKTQNIDMKAYKYRAGRSSRFGKLVVFIEFGFTNCIKANSIGSISLKVVLD